MVTLYWIDFFPLLGPKVFKMSVTKALKSETITGVS